MELRPLARIDGESNGRRGQYRAWAMPWCEPCDSFYNPNTLRADGTCPRCGGQVGDPSAVSADVGEPQGASRPAPRDSTERRSSVPEPELVDDDEELVATVPWHFWVGVIAMVIYLGWRLIQGVAWFF